MRYDVIGQHKYGHYDGVGFCCTCEWGYATHGIACPEHGIEGLVLVLTLPGVPVVEHQAGTVVPEVTKGRIAAEENP